MTITNRYIALFSLLHRCQQGGRVFIVALLLLSGSVFSQSRQTRTEVGNPIAELHTAKEYNAHGQNFAVVQDKRGVLYFGNFAGVLEYDGSTWRTIPTNNYAKVSSLYLDPSGRIFVGANGEFGYLKPDKKGALQFASLSSKITSPFGEIITIIGTNAGIYFIGKKNIYLWNRKIIKEWVVNELILSAFDVNGKIYFYQKNSGLVYFDGKKKVSVTTPARFPALLDVTAMLSLNAQTELVVTSNQGLFKISNNYLDRFDCPANAYLSANQPTAGLELSDKSLALATLQGGVALLDQAGNIKQIITGRDFEENQTNSMFQSRGGILWLALNNGIAQVDIPSPISVFNDAFGVKGEVRDVLRHQNQVYIATLNGLNYLQGFGTRQVANLNASCFHLAEANSTLLVATSKGVYRVDGTSARSLSSDFALFLHPLRQNSSLVFVGLESGLGILDLARNSYRVVEGLDDQITGITEDDDGNVWLETLSKGLYRTDAQASRRLLYGKSKGLTTLLYNQVLYSTKGLLAWNKNGIFQYDNGKDLFVPYNLFKTDSSAASYWKGSLVEDRNGNFWTTRGDEKVITLYQKTGSEEYRKITQPFQAFSDRTFKIIYPDADSIVWFGGPTGAIRFDLRQSDDYLKSYPALIRRINLKGDSLAFDGYVKGEVTLKNAVANPTRLRVDYDLNDISFIFSATSFNVGEELSFRYYLENYDDTWSDWTPQNQKEYTNLSPGRYTFHVKSRNIYDIESEESVFEFVIRKPWYLMWWSYLLYFLVLVVSLYFLIRWRLKALVKEKDLLENMIMERTEEISSQKEELEEQSQELSYKNDQLEKIDQIVQSINSEIEFTSLFETVLAKLIIIRNMESATALIYDKDSNSFRFKGAYGNLELDQLDSLQLTLQQAEERYVQNAEERAEDVYVKTGIPFHPLGNALDTLPEPKSLITIVINVEGHVEGFITLENTTRTNAFDQRDINMIRNLKEHLIAAFIKTRILENLEKTLSNLKVAQEELIRQERLASVGQLTRGIVDRILNPLNYINNFSESSNDLIEELVEMVPESSKALPEEIADDYYGDMEMLKLNLVKIREHGNSTTRIVKDMQRLLKEKSTEFLETDLNVFLETRVKLAFQELKNENRDSDAELALVFDLEPQSAKVRVLPHEMGSVISNIVSNSYYATADKNKHSKQYSPELRVSTNTIGRKVFIRFRDNGKGVPKKEMEQMFSPFFTTKPTSKGTGLGLYMSKDIVELHKGLIELESAEGEYAEITIMLPVY